MNHDVIIIGGGPAGLQAALTLGRIHRDSLLLDSGSYRNDPATHSHNMLTRDGIPPGELRRIGREELRSYQTVTTQPLAVESVAPVPGGFAVRAGGGDLTCRSLILATGARDVLPSKPGLAELFGTLAAHCPFCHGHEFAGQRVAVLGGLDHIAFKALLLHRIAAELVVLTDGDELPATQRAAAERGGLVIRPEPVAGFRRSGDVAVVEFADGTELPVGGLLVATEMVDSAPLADQLGLDRQPSGFVAVDAFGRTSLPGVYAAGDLAHLAELPMPMSSVLTSAAAGQVAAATCDRELLMADFLPTA